MSVFDIFARLEREKAQKEAAAVPIEWLVVGLGNPGSRYENTRHNAGFRALDAYCRHSGQRIDRLKFKSLVGEGTFGGRRVLFLKPQTFMNLSGEAVRDAAAMVVSVGCVDPARAIHRAEGVYDVLDHATATPGFGGKLAFDLTDSADAPEWAPPPVPEPEPGVRYRTDFLAEWGVLAAFAEPGAEPVPPPGVKYFAVFDAEAEGLTGEELLWLAAADTDPRRDVVLRDGTLAVDARGKRPGAPGHPARFPNPVVSDEATIAKVDARWDEYGLGAFVASPSRRYRVLLRSDGAAW